jgi:hypothetical protein
VQSLKKSLDKIRVKNLIRNDSLNKLVLVFTTLLAHAILSEMI